MVDRRPFPSGGPISILWIPGSFLLVAGLSYNFVSRLYLGKILFGSGEDQTRSQADLEWAIRIIRHPIYLSAILFTFCPPVILGSLYWFIAPLVIMPMLLHRISVEEKFLSPSLEENIWSILTEPSGSFPFIY